MKKKAVNPSPVKKDEEFIIDISDLSSEGAGIGRISDSSRPELSGFPLFIKDTCIGDRVKVKVIKALKNMAYARLETIVQSSEWRTVPLCENAKACGGCQLQHTDYRRELEYKRNKVKNNLIRIGSIPEELVDRVLEDITGMDGDPWRYRNKEQYPAGENNGRIVTGFYAARTHDIIETNDCLLSPVEFAGIVRMVREHFEDRGIPAYNEKDRSGVLRHILIRKGFSTGELMVCLVLNKTGASVKDGFFFEGQKALTEKLGAVPGMTSICVNLQPDNTNVILGKETYILYGDGYIRDVLRGMEFRISPRSFYQINPVQTELLYAKVSEYAALTGKEHVWDVYCGTGTIGLTLARDAGKLTGIEIIPEAVKDAEYNAERNGITNAEYYTGAAEEILPKLVSEDDGKENVVIVDPPRSGCEKPCLDAILAIKPSLIVYVSCDSATLARDLKYLREGGYDLKKAAPYDLFPHTVHCETCVLLTRAGE